MIPCTEFIPAYSELFAFLEKTGGKQAVMDYWEHMAAAGIPLLEEHVRRDGILGCYKYWSHTLNEEAADFTMRCDEENGVFTIEMRHCPSKGRLLEWKRFTPYPDYCEHCDVIYRRVLEPLGFVYEYDLSQSGRARCSLRISRRDNQSVSKKEDDK